MKRKIIAIGKGIIRKEPNYVFYFLSFWRGIGFGLIGAVYTLLLFSKGLNPLQVNLINLAFLGSSFLFQIPTGALADSWGRKKAFLVSVILIAGSFFTYALGGVWQHFVFAEFLSGLGFAFMTGSLDAWAVDQYKLVGFTGRTDFLFSRSEVCLNSGQIVGAMITSIIINFGLQFPFWLGGFVFLLIFFLAQKLIEEEKMKIKKEKLNFQDVIEVSKTGVKISFAKREIGLIILFAALMMMGFKALDMFWSKRFESMSNLAAVSRIWIFMDLFLIAGSHLVKKWADKGKGQLQGLMIVAFMTSLLIFLSLSRQFLAAAMFFISYEIFRGAFRPLQSSFLNYHTPSAVRATVLSFNSMVMIFGGMIGLVISGVIAKNFSIETAWLGSSLIFLLSLIPIIFLKKKINS